MKETILNELQSRQSQMGDGCVSRASNHMSRGKKIVEAGMNNMLENKLQGRSKKL